jgi:2,5-dioxopentanoate dehydrogenase
MATHKDATTEDINAAMEIAWAAFQIYKSFSLRRRADFMRSIGEELNLREEEIIKQAMLETNLPEARLRGEKSRTVFQLNSYADFCESGIWLDARIDHAIPDKAPPKPDIRKMLVPLGPVVVFGASNFPFAYSTAGGDTASALAAGCPVVVKAHPAHARTSELVAEAIYSAAKKNGIPSGTFIHLNGAAIEVGEALVKHPYTKAVGFTGSFQGGKQLFDWGNQRKEPIPVFAEMGSVNPVYLFPGKLRLEAEKVAQQYAGSITLSAGQFCTNPGIIIGVENPDLQRFVKALGHEIKLSSPATMLHVGIYKSYVEKRAAALSQTGVSTEAVSETDAALNQGTPTIASVDGKTFLENPLLHQEVFGPYSLVVRCSSLDEMKAIASAIEGQLTSSLMATDQDIIENNELVELIKNTCGRCILNGVPTGVEVCLSMQHGGPFPATTDSRFTSVGGDAIKRFARPLAYQNWPESLLPDELKNSNPLGIWRIVNGLPGKL